MTLASDAGSMSGTDSLPGRVPGARTIRRLHVGPTGRVWALLLIMLLLYFAISPQSFNVLTFNQLLQNAAPLAIVGIAQMTVLVAGQIDLSVGSVMSLATTIAATRMHDSWASLILIILTVVVIGCFLGWVNGFLIGFRGLNSFVVTLATWSIISGFALFVLPSAGGATPGKFTSLLNVMSPVSFGAWALAIVALIWLWVRSSGAFILLKGVGAAPEKAAWTGVPRRRVITLAFTVSAALAAVSGLMLAGITGSGDPTIGVSYILNSVAAGVIGGVSLFGGRGSVIGVIGAALVLTLVNNVVFALGVTSYITPAVIGILLLGAVVLTGVGIRSFR